MKASLELLGTSPSALVREDPAVTAVRETGYEVTDFAGLFTTPRARFLVTRGASSPALSIAEKIRIEPAGPLPVPSGKLVVFDPCDDAWLDRTVLPIAARLPPGDHDTFYALDDAELVAIVVVFAGEREVVGWRPALLGDDPGGPMPTPPWFAMPPVRWSLGLADANLVAEILGRVLVELDAGRAEAIAEVFGPPRDHAAPARLPDGKHPILEHLRRAFSRSSAIRASRGGVLAFRCEDAPTSWLGIDGSGEPRALAFDFGALRRRDTTPRVSAPGLLLDLDSLAERFRVAGYPASETRELARSFLARVEACGEHLEAFAPTEPDRVLLEMPAGLRRAALAVEAEERARAASARPEVPVARPSRERLLSMSIEDFGIELSVAACKVMRALELETVADLAALSERELARAIERAHPEDKVKPGLSPTVAHRREVLNEMVREKRRRIAEEIVGALAAISVSLRPE